MVETDNSLAYVEGVDGCGLPCNSPLFTKEEHEQVQRFTRTLAAMCLTTNLFAVVKKKALNYKTAVDSYYYHMSNYL